MDDDIRFTSPVETDDDHLPTLSGTRDLSPGSESLPRAALGGALRASLPLAAAVAPLALMTPWLGPAAFRALAALGLPPMVRLLGFNAFLYLMVLGGAMVLASLLRAPVTAAARRSREEGQATVAGICLGATATGLGMIVLAGLAQGEFTFLETGGRLLAVALGVGYLGGQGFSTVATVRGERRHLPALYHGMRGAGLSVVGGLCLGTVWSVAAQFLPWVGPAFLASWLLPVVTLPAIAGVILMVTAPAAATAARLLRRSSPEAPRGAITLGVAATGSLLAGFAGWQFFVHLASLVHLPSVWGGFTLLMVGWLVHLGLVWRGSGLPEEPEESPRRLEA